MHTFVFRFFCSVAYLLDLYRNFTLARGSVQVSGHCKKFQNESDTMKLLKAVPMTVFLLVAIFGASPAGAVSLDPSFGNGGTVITRTGNPAYGPNLTGNVWAIAEDRRGRLLAAGGTGAEALVVRYLPDGRLDPTFGVGGKAQFPSVLGGTTPESWAGRFRAISILRNGKIMLGGEVLRISGPFRNSPESYFMRLFPNGAPDPAFANYPNYIDAPQPPLVVLPNMGGDIEDMVVHIGTAGSLSLALTPSPSTRRTGTWVM